MSDRPIPFSAPMIRALLDGRKRQTRRLETSPLRNAQPGDRLWVREAWRTGLAYDDLAPSEMGGEEQVRFEADGATERWTHGSTEPGRLRAGMHMPRWASRLTLIVEAVKFEPLQAISEEDAIAEGIARGGFGGLWGWIDYGGLSSNMQRYYSDPRESFRSLWKSLHGPDAWDANPRLVVPTFRVERGNIDRIAA